MKRYTSAVMSFVMSALFMGAYAQEHQSDGATEREALADHEKPHFEDLDDRYSYAYGVNLARGFKKEGIDINVSLLAEAMQAVFDGNDPNMSIEEVGTTMRLFDEIHFKKKEIERAKIGKVNKKEGKKFLAQNAKKDAVVVTDSGLQYKVITKGDGSYRPSLNDVVTVHYRAGFVDGSTFDSTYQRDEPFSGKVAKLIPGWSEAVQMMTEGSKWELYIPDDLAYGDKGSADFVGPNATLIFEVELLEIEKSE